MGRRRKKAAKSSEPIPSAVADITLSDYANSTTPRARPKKGSTGLAKVATEVLQSNLPDEDPAWDDDNFVLAEKSKLPPENEQRSDQLGDGGKDYPIDIWFLISEHVVPEDVGVFSAICKTSYAVVNSAKFWFNMYKRFYKNTGKMPESLQPGYMARKYGLRGLVIRSLYYMYPPFVEKIAASPEIDVSRLIGRVCHIASVLEIKRKDQWMYSFKLRESKRPGAKEKPMLLDMLEDIDANVDEGSKVLQVRANHYCPIPMLSGQVLTQALVRVSHDLHFQCLSFVFRQGPSGYLSTSLVLDKVLNFRILDWWHPAYPHSDHLSQSLFAHRPLLDRNFADS